jgi:hypothetical protein
MADGGWRYRQFLARATEAAMGGNGGEDRQLRELSSVH